jgi:uncharacterized membrane protein YphA (DoxX/SURF4 family)
MAYNPLPELLWIGPLLIPVILRAASGIALLTLCFKTTRHYRTSLEKTKLRKTIMGGLYGITSVCLLMGLFTQYAAILGTLTALFIVFFGGRFTDLYRDSGLFYLLLIAILLSLILTGAGPLALDSPL